MVCFPSGPRLPHLRLLRWLRQPPPTPLLHLHTDPFRRSPCTRHRNLDCPACPVMTVCGALASGDHRWALNPGMITQNL
jgi:hypothetical protein